METRRANAGSGTSVVPATGPNICRICLTNGGGGGKQSPTGMESIFSTVADYDNKTLYGILLEVCTPLGQRDQLIGMPERICRGCKWRLLTAYELYETCLRSDEKMREVSARERQVKQVIHTDKKDDQIVIKQELTDPDEMASSFQQDTTMTDYSDASALLLESHFYPEAESSLMISPSPNLLEEMTPAVDHNETFFAEHYRAGENGIHRCGICEAEFPYKSSARTHILAKHDPSKPFKCDVCFFTLTTELRLIRHKAVWHGAGVIKCDQSAEGKDESGETIYTCKICSKTFTSMVRFKRHKNVHVAFNRPFKCETCLYRFQTRSLLQSHIKTHQEKPEGDQGPEQDRVWPCEFCEEKLPNKRAQTMHVRRFHPEQALAEGIGANSGDKNEYKCIICSQAFPRESVLNTHMKMHELLAAEKEKEQRQQLEALIKKEQQQLDSFSISNNNISASSNVSAQFNVEASGKKRSDVDMAFVCIVCEQEFEERDLLLKHQKKLHQELELNIVSSGAVQEQDMMEEAPADEDDRTDQDQDESMVVDLDPTEFLATENGQTKRASTSLPKCHLCGKTFMYNCLLQSHIKKSHSESKPFECKTCHMRFGYRGTLQKHELTHSAQNVRAGGHGSIMYKCKICAAKFLELKLLTFHLKTHRNASVEEPTGPAKKVEIFACSFCPQIFSAKDEFDQHLVKKHRQSLPPPPPLQPAPQQHFNRESPTPAQRKLTERRTPMNEKEMFFDSLSIVKLEHPLGTVNLD